MAAPRFPPRPGVRAAQVRAGGGSPDGTFGQGSLRWEAAPGKLASLATEGRGTMSQQREQVRTESQPVGAFSLTALRDTPRYTYLVAAVAALGGMLFGYDIGVISGAENLPSVVPARHRRPASLLISAVTGGLIGGQAGRQVQPPPHTDRDWPCCTGRAPSLTALSFSLVSFSGVPDHHRHRRRRLLAGRPGLHRVDVSRPSIRGGLVVAAAARDLRRDPDLLCAGLRVRLGGLGLAPVVGFAVVPAARAHRRHAGSCPTPPVARHARPLGRGQRGLCSVNP